jgi:hypothetical protein
MKLALTIASLCTLLGACGAEVATTAATTTKLQAAQVEQAKAQSEKIKNGLDAAMRKAEAAASAAANQ